MLSHSKGPPRAKYAPQRNGKSGLAFLWHLGRYGQYLGIFGSLVGPALIIGTKLWQADGSGAPVHWESLVGATAAVCLCCWAVVVASVSLKSYARKRGDPTSLFGQE